MSSKQTLPVSLFTYRALSTFSKDCRRLHMHSLAVPAVYVNRGSGSHCLILFLTLLMVRMVLLFICSQSWHSMWDLMRPFFRYILLDPQSAGQTGHMKSSLVSMVISICKTDTEIRETVMSFVVLECFPCLQVKLAYIFLCLFVEFVMCTMISKHAFG